VVAPFDLDIVVHGRMPRKVNGYSATIYCVFEVLGVRDTIPVNSDILVLYLILVTVLILFGIIKLSSSSVLVLVLLKIGFSVLVLHIILVLLLVLSQ